MPVTSHEETHDDAPHGPPPQPAWLAENEGALQYDGVLHLFDTLTGPALAAWLTKLRDKPEVKGLEFSGQYLTPDDLRALAPSGLTLALRDLSLDVLAEAPAAFERIVGLSVQSDPRTDAGRGCVGRLVNLRALRLFLGSFTDDDLRFLSQLERLELRSVAVRGGFLAHLAKPEGLRALELTELRGSAWGDPSGSPLTGAELAGLARCTALRTLGLGTLQLAPDALAGMRAFTALESLSLVGLAAKKLDLRPVAHAAKTLRTLSWGALELTTAVADGLCASPRFAELRGYGRGRFAKGAFAKLAGCARLTTLDVGEFSGPTDADLAAFAGHPALASLGLGGDGVTDAAVEHLAKIPALWGLALRKTAVTDAGVAKLAAGPLGRRLESLNLSHSAVTDACIASIVACEKLANVGLGKTKVSKKGLAELKNKRPELGVSTSGF